MNALLFFVWFGSMIAGLALDNGRGLFLGMFIGPLGVMIALLLSSQDKKHKEVLEALAK